MRAAFGLGRLQLTALIGVTGVAIVMPGARGHGNGDDGAWRALKSVRIWITSSSALMGV
jgi:hypothetical protein